MYYMIGVSVPSLHRESTDSLLNNLRELPINLPEDTMSFRTLGKKLILGSYMN